jgi:hypothetical protein
MSEITADTTTPTPDGGNASAEAQTPSVPATESTKPDDTTAKPDAQAAKPDEAAKPDVPESYDLQMPEGVELDTAAAKEFTDLAKELKLDNGTAQKFAGIAASMAQRQMQAHADLVSGWAEQVKTDKEIGGDKLDQNLAVARKAIDAFGSPELKAVLESTGLGNHPAVVKAFFKAGKAISDDVMVAGAASRSAVGRDAAAVLYGSKT